MPRKPSVRPLLISYWIPPVHSLTSWGFNSGSIGVWVEPRLPISATTNALAGELRVETLMFLSVWVVSLPARTLRSSGSGVATYFAQFKNCLLYTSDAADER